MSNLRKKTLAIVMKRTDFGEADRIVNILTPAGREVVIARGVRKQKSKLAGGIEFFAINEVVLIEGKSEMKTLSSARMIEFFSEILKDFERTEFAYQAIKDVFRLSDQIESADFFEILAKAFRSLNSYEISLDLTKKWFSLKIAEFSGNEINLETSKNGEKLKPDLKYGFDFFDRVFFEDLKGEYSANDIKFLRLMVSSEPKIISKIKGCDIFLNKISKIIYSVNK